MACTVSKQISKTFKRKKRASVLITFLVAVTKTPAKSEVDKEELIWVSQSVRVRKALQQKPHVTGEVLSAVRKQRTGAGTCSPSSLLLYSVPELSPLSRPGFSPQ